jgi:nuclear pore complex protein Nup214
MHIPSLEGVYQTLSKLQEIIHTQVVKLSSIKKKIGMKENIHRVRLQNLTSKDRWVEFSLLFPFVCFNGFTCLFSFMDSLTDSLISMSIADQVKGDASKLSFSKLEQLKEALHGRKIVQIKPNRPNRPGLNSEVVKEKLLQSSE